MLAGSFRKQVVVGVVDGAAVAYCVTNEFLRAEDKKTRQAKRTPDCCIELYTFCMACDTSYLESAKGVWARADALAAREVTLLPLSSF